MGITNFVLHQAIKRRMRQVQAALRDPMAAQERLLLSFIRRAENTEWGRSHDYRSIRSIRDYQKAVPLCRYEDLAPLWLKALDGARDVTWPGHIKYFALSSGTTTAKTKMLPVSKEAIHANFRSGTTALGYLERQLPASSLAGKTIYFGGSIQLIHDGACLKGDASGINVANLPSFTWRYRLPPRDIAVMTDWEEKVEAMCRCCLDSHVTGAVGLPSWTLILFRKILDHARDKGRQARTVSDLWPDLASFVHFGMSFEPYRKQFEEIVGRPLVTMDTYSSSEGGLNAIQTDPRDPGMQLEIDTCAFYEFVPAEEIGRPDATRLTLGEVETGVPYALLLSTPSGIWAYDVGDMIRFTSLHPPKLLIVGRTKLALNTFGEHVIQENLEHAVIEASRALNVNVSEFTVTSLPPTAADPHGQHLWLVEFEGPQPPLDAFASKLDASVCAQSEDYELHRTNNYSMLPPEVVPLEPGTFYEWARRHGALGSQHKVPRVARSAQMVDELRELSRGLATSRGTSPSA